MRILSLHPVATELIFAIGAGNMLVGRTDHCTYPEAALSIPSIGSPDQITQDAIAIFEPDIVFLGPQQQIDIHKSVHIDPRSIPELFEMIASLGMIFSKTLEAEVVMHDLRLTLEKVKTKCARFSKTQVLVDGTSFGYIPELITLAGGEISSNPQIILTIGDEAYIESKRDAWKDLQAYRHERVFTVEEELLRPTPRLIQGVKRIAKILHGVEINGD